MTPSALPALPPLATPALHVLLPGLACDAALFAPQAAALRARYGDAAVQVSDVHTRAPTLAAMAERLLAETSGPLRLIGCSMGGMVALEAVRQAPGRIAALALLGSSARPDSAAMVFLRREAIKRFEAGRVEEVLRANLGAAFHPGRIGDRALIDAYYRMVLRAGAAQLIAQNRAVMARADLRPTLAAIGCPTLVLVGEADLLTPPAEARELAEGIAGARLVELPGCGHMLTMEAPQRVGDELLAWLATLDEPASAQSVTPG
ncbi:MAG TPA: alpha/beta fold hydrolase [Burkholderiaceae bacterium]|nr:alpha/beta fold hydrolase [Burkholderiaceae bacterium]HNG80245.1 alpha/beta fold hydrolase [Burkholderiaceae bacterium]